MRRRPFRLIAITSSIAIVASVGAVSFDGTARAGAVTVRSGDTLWALSRTYHVDVSQLASANGMQEQDVLAVGRDIAIPSSKSASPKAVTSAASRAATSARSMAATSQAATSKAATSKSATSKSATSKSATSKSASTPGTVGSAPAGPAAGVVVANPYTAAQLAQMRSFCVNYRAPAGSASLPAALAEHPERLALRPLFVKWSRAYGVPTSLIQAIAWQESGWQNDVVSSANAQGIGQLLPTTASFVSGGLLGLKLNVTVASDNIQMMVRFFAYLLKASGGNQCVAVASYYQGYGAFQHVGVLPESQIYVRSVFTLRSRFA